MHWIWITCSAACTEDAGDARQQFLHALELGSIQCRKPVLPRNSHQTTASSKDVVRQLCQESFSSSCLDSESLLDKTCSSLSVPQGEAAQLLQALHHFTRLVAFRDLSSAEAILALFPENFHQNLKNLLTKIIVEHISTWRAEAQANQISLPRLVDLDWRVDIKTSSDNISRMAVPTCLLQMKIQEDPSLCGEKPSISAVTMELSKETLDTMLDGLGRIRDQLSAVANK